jgi:hypothetical protein
LLQFTPLKAASSCFNLHPDRVKFKLFGGSLLERSSLIITSDFRFGQPEPTTFNVDLTKQCRHELEITSIRQQFLHNKNIKGGQTAIIPCIFPQTYSIPRPILVRQQIFWLLPEPGSA